jgi:glutamate N-acetyltransferase/amino-acid N-acetyltransferase
MISYSSAEEYRNAVELRAALPEGFQAGRTSLSFVPKEKPGRQAMNLSLILLDEATSSFAGVTTRNRFCGAPVRICRQRLGGETVRGILVNNRVANVGAPHGEEAALAVLGRLGALLGVPANELLPASTGVVGWGLPQVEFEAALPGLVESLQGDSLLPVAEGIMTTDSWPKLHREAVGEGHVLGVAKGAGMIEPNMATLLVFLLTDVRVSREQLRADLTYCVQQSFNRISVDGDQSTSDMALALSSGTKGGAGSGAFRDALLAVCRRLAEDVVRNGEGVGHVIRVRVRGAGPELALSAGKAVVNSPLVKTAVFGNDPNVGRIVSALGDYLGNGGVEGLDPSGFRISMGGVTVFDRGAFALDPDRERHLADYLRSCALEPGRMPFPAHDRSVEIDVDLGSAGGEPVEVIGADLSYEYVRENADYRS